VTAPTVGTVASTAALHVAANGSSSPTPTAAASAEVDGLDALALSAVRIDADTVLATAETTGSCASSPGAAGSTRIEHGRISVAGGAPAVVDIDSRPAPNTVAFSGLGVRVVLNEQSATHGGRGIAVNAIHIYLDGLLVEGLPLSGDIVVASASASLDCAAGQGADLRLTLLSDPPVADPGQPLTLTAIVDNLGPSPAGDVTLQVTVPDGLSVDRIEPSQGQCSGEATIGCTLGNIDAGKGAEVTIETHVAEDATGSITVHGVTQSPVADPHPGNNSATLVIPVNRADCGVGAPAASLILDGGRFKVDVQYQRPGSKKLSAATAVRLGDQSGFFWFFEPSNAEVFVKVIDACDTTGQIWVFAGGLTNLRLTARITDRNTGKTLEYKNAAGKLFAARADTKVFGCRR
jgi:uncharacterized repeat protein (TIGR01451 family)